MSKQTRDAELSRQLRRLAKKVDKLVTRELGEQHTIGLVIQPTGQDGEIAEFQYISNTARAFMHEAFRELVRKWDAGMADIPYHEKQ